MYDPTTMKPGATILLAYGQHGTQVARIEHETANTLQIRRLTYRGYPGARWADTCSPMPKKDPRIGHAVSAAELRHDPAPPTPAELHATADKEQARIDKQRAGHPIWAAREDRRVSRIRADADRLAALLKTLRPGDAA